jgi:hypothetical protein
MTFGYLLSISQTYDKISRMLTIREAQLRTLQEQSKAGFRHRLRARLLSILPAESFPTADLDTHIDRGLEQARDCGLTSEADVARFVEAVCLYLHGFSPEGLPKEALPGLYAFHVKPAVKVERFVAWCKSGGGAD